MLVGICLVLIVVLYEAQLWLHRKRERYMTAEVQTFADGLHEDSRVIVTYPDGRTVQFTVCDVERAEAISPARAAHEPELGGEG